MGRGVRGSALSLLLSRRPHSILSNMQTLMFAFLAALAISSVNGGSEAHPCNAAASDFQQCVRYTIQHLVPQLGAGLPNIGAEGVDPLKNLPPVQHSSHGLNVQLDEVVIRGLSTAIIGDVNVDLNSNTISIHSSLPGQISATGVQTTEGEIMGIPLRGSGPFKLSLANPSLYLTLSGVPAVAADGQAYLQLQSAHVKLQPGSVSIDVDGFFSQFAPLARAASSFANSVAGPVVAEMKPSLEKWLAGIALQRAQAVFSAVPYDTIFPGRTPAVAGLYRALPIAPPLLHRFY